MTILPNSGKMVIVVVLIMDKSKVHIYCLALLISNGAKRLCVLPIWFQLCLIFPLNLIPLLPGYSRGGGKAAMEVGNRIYCVCK